MRHHRGRKSTRPASGPSGAIGGAVRRFFFATRTLQVKRTAKPEWNVTEFSGWFGRIAAGAACGLLACALFSMSAAARAQQAGALPADADVPPPGYAYVLPIPPQARMLEDGTTCELIAGILTHAGEPVDGGVLLYRDRSSRHFRELSTREDGLVIAHFDAEPNEIVLGRAYWREMRGMDVRYGPRISTQCRSGNVSLGEPNRVPSP